MAARYLGIYIYRSVLDFLLQLLLLLLLLLLQLLLLLVLLSSEKNVIKRKLAWWRLSLVGNVVGSINEVNQRRARLVIGWVTVCRRINHLGT